MMYIDVKYANLLAPRLDRYRVTKNNPYTASFRCPLCGDSQKSKSKTRGYFYVAYQKLRMKCHNCAASLNFNNFLKQLDNDLYKQYTLETFGGRGEAVPDIDMTMKRPVFDKPEPSLLDELMDRLDTLPGDHEAIRYVEGRLIPKNRYHRLFYIDDVSKIAQLDEKYKEKILGKESRIALPFYNRQGRLTGLTMRALGEHKLRYISINIVEGVPQIYNLDKVNFNRKVICVEGAFDSLFLNNAVAVGGSSMKAVRKLLPKDAIYVFDNEPRNSEICKLIHKQIESGFTVCIWPKNIEEKDINEMVKTGLEVEDIIHSISCAGLEARMKFSQWRKC
jgi:transcription elongation factor Elf1